jgi:UDP-glucose 4-epimerase
MATRTAGDVPAGVVVGNIHGDTDWTLALQGCKMVVHLAARVHVMRDAVADPLAEFRTVNVDGTLNLARQAAACGVQRFLFLSSIKVNGEGRDTPYCEVDVPVPEDAYARSKWEAEQGLRQIAARTGMEVVILRPPLVYGPGVDANFRRLLRLIAVFRVLPFGRVDNRRSLLFIGNLTDAIRVCLEHAAAANRTFLVADAEAVSTPELARRLAQEMGLKMYLLPVPQQWFGIVGRLLGKGREVSRLLGSLCVDSRVIRTELSWTQPFSLDEGLRLTVADGPAQRKWWAP